MTVLFSGQHVTLATHVKILFWSRNPLIFHPPSLVRQVGGPYGALRPSVRQSEVSLCQKGENWRSRRQLWGFFPNVFFMAKWCHQMFVCAKSKIILLFSIFLKNKFDAKLPWLHTKKWSLLELSSERFGAILPRFGALFKSERHSMEYGLQYSNTQTHFT